MSAPTRRPRLVIPDDYNDVYATSLVVEALGERCDVQIFTSPFQSLDELVERIGDAEIIVANRERLPLGAPLFDRVPSLRLVAQTASRGAHLDMSAASERGILVAGTESADASTVELTIGLAIAAMRRIPYGDAELRAGRWSPFVGRELRGRHLGIMGLGRIGTRVAGIARAMGMEVSAWGPTLTPERASASGATYRPLEELLPSVDVLSLHLALLPATRGVLDRRLLGLLRPSALLVNTARAGLLDEEALVEMLQQGRLRGAALDVFGAEPLPPDHPLLRLPNVVLTPHIGWVAEDSYATFFEGITANVLAYLDGCPIPRLLNPAVLEHARFHQPA
ncbi:MAG: D-2-hydroxyacid dehydrogenase family protein [Chloroflexi bacterium]|nr:D-2-hydroxyacid dehydrogenase family protein [Chloroflexota bacterium]